jgi:hypothetical protein
MVSNVFWERSTLTWALQPAPMDKKSSIFSMPSFAYSSKEIDVFIEEVNKLAKEVNNLNFVIRHLREQLLEEENHLLSSSLP